MTKEVILMLHPTTGILAILAATWLFADALNINPNVIPRIKLLSVVQAIMIWLSFIFGGYWYMMYYSSDKAIIKMGPWPLAHSFFMESKEHVFLMLLLLCTYLPIITFSNNLLVNKQTRHLVLWVAALIVFMALAMEGAGAIVSLGVKVALLMKQ